MALAGLKPLDALIDHVRGREGALTVIEYGDYACPHSRAAWRAIERIEQQFPHGVRFAFRHFPLLERHRHAFAAAAAAEAAALQGRFWEMHELLFARQPSLEDDDLERYAIGSGLDVGRFHDDRYSLEVLRRVGRDIASGLASGVDGTPTLFVDGVR